MHLTLITIGSRGDVQPFIALGSGLQAAGHTIRLVTHALFADFAARYGLEFAPVEGNPQELMQSEQGQDFIGSSRNPLALFKSIRDIADGLFEGMMRDMLAACEGADAVLFSSVAFLAAYSVVEKLGLPSLGAYLQPMNPTRAFPMAPLPPLPAWAPLREAYNAWSYEVGFRLTSRLFIPSIDRARARVLDLPPVAMPFHQSIKLPFPILYGFSPQVVPRPADWHDQLYLTGYWFLNEGRAWQPSAALSDFLAAGPPPVYIGFGSLSYGDSEATTTLMLRALARSGQRGLLLSGWGGITAYDLPANVFLVDSVPHDWLFPRMAAVVHHGGAGTTAAGLRAGVPSIVVPFMGDQPFWADRVAALGVGPQPIPHEQLTADRLAYAIRVAVEHAGIRQRAAALREKLRAEDGVANAVRVIQGMFPQGGH